MIVFNTFLKIVKKSLVPVIMFTVILVMFGVFNFQTSDSSLSFEAEKPDVLIINNDSDVLIAENLISYIRENCNIISVSLNEDCINDALFYRDVNYIIIIPDNFRDDFFSGKNPKIEVKSTGDYLASLAELMLERYLKVLNIYSKTFTDEADLINSINETLSINTKVELTSKLDTDNLSKMAFFYNFANYSILAGCVFVICLILSSFKNENIKKRTIISSMNYKDYNRKLLLSNSLFVIVLWLFYVILSYILIGDIIFTKHGLIYIINLFIFSMCSLSMAFLIGNLVSNKNAINGIVNVVALGSSFLCGAFVPTEFLPDIVLKIAHFLPSYYYINTNDVVKNLEVINTSTLEVVLINMFVMIIFIIVFVIINNILSKRRQKIG